MLQHWNWICSRHMLKRHASNTNKNALGIAESLKTLVKSIKVWENMGM